MVTRAQIEAEAEWVIDLIQRTRNPTGTNHSPLPWQADNSKYKGRITSATGTFIGFFRRPEDRDLALYFANAHPGIFSLLRQLADSFEFIAGGTDDEGLKHYALERAEATRIYAELFERLGRPEGPRQ